MAGSLVFPRGSHVLEYWLAHAEGFTVRSHGPVEQVIVEPLYGRATALVVRTGVLRRREVVSAAAVTAVDPEARMLELEVSKAKVGPSAPGRGRVWLGARLRAAAREAWAVMTALLSAAGETGRVLVERSGSWYAGRREAAAQVRRRHAETRARVRARDGAQEARRAAAARARRPRGAVGRHVRP